MSSPKAAFRIYRGRSLRSGWPQAWPPACNYPGKSLVPAPAILAELLSVEEWSLFMYRVNALEKRYLDGARDVLPIGAGLEPTCCVCLQIMLCPCYFFCCSNRSLKLRKHQRKHLQRLQQAAAKLSDDILRPRGASIKIGVDPSTSRAKYEQMFYIEFQMPGVRLLQLGMEEAEASDAEHSSTQEQNTNLLPDANVNDTEEDEEDKHPELHVDRQDPHCWNCRKFLAHQDPFCEYCGVDARTVPPTQRDQCTECGRQMPQQSTFCGHCGHVDDRNVPIVPATLPMNPYSPFIGHPATI